jgi:hypothetical protein
MHGLDPKLGTENRAVAIRTSVRCKVSLFLSVSNLGSYPQCVGDRCAKCTEIVSFSGAEFCTIGW